jgi:hypothetical protein
MFVANIYTRSVATKGQVGVHVYTRSVETRACCCTYLYPSCGNKGRLGHASMPVAWQQELVGIFYIPGNRIGVGHTCVALLYFRILWAAFPYLPYPYFGKHLLVVDNLDHANFATR